MHAKILGAEESSFHFNFENAESHRRMKLSNLPCEMINGWKITSVESLATVRYLLHNSY